MFLSAALASVRVLRVLSLLQRPDPPGPEGRAAPNLDVLSLVFDEKSVGNPAA